MTDLDKAREWADRWSEDDPLILADAKAAIKLIKGLPDQWVDVEEVREVINGQLSVYTRGTASHYIAEEITRKLKEALIAPKLPTLADMTQEERAACKWMQARVYDNDGTVVLLSLNEARQSAKYLCSGKEVGSRGYSAITPLPDLPKLQWPGNEPESTHFDNLPEEAKQVMKESIEDFKAGRFVDFDSSPRPEDVPAGEPWIVEYDGIRHVGAREKGAVTYLDWALARLDGTECVAARDREITLVSRLVPESHTLPEGMRLADHEEYGRVIVSPGVTEYGFHTVFYLDDAYFSGASERYAKPDELIFLDGEQ